ncbi:MAG: SMI1/KNR4 family protein [Ruminococcus sp.]|nr:SMI1/KNR4 family protein [Ruminococcus sp.]
MFFSVKYPEIMEAVEEKLKKQVEDKGFDFEAIKKDVDAGLSFEREYYGIVSWGLNYALMRVVSEPLFIDYSEVFWIYGAKTTSDDYCVVIYFFDGSDTLFKVRDEKDIKSIFKLIINSNPDTLIGYSKKNEKKYKAYKKSLGIEDEQSDTPTVPKPVAKLPRDKVKSMKNKFEYIISLSEKLAGIDKFWYFKTNEPLNKEDIRKWCKSNGVSLPESFVTILTRTNGFCVDYSSTVGYFNINRFDVESTTKSLYSRTKEEMLAREYDYYKNCHSCFGWLNHQCLYYNPYTGEIFIEKERYKYTLIEDFEKEILDKVISYLEKKVIRFERKERLLEENKKNNPMLEMYEKLLELRGNSDNINTGFDLYEPLTKEEISDWEKKHNIQLPQEYKDWLALSDGGRFADKWINSLENLRIENLIIDTDEGKDYIVIASLSLSSDYLLLDPETSELVVVTDDGDLEEGDFVYDIFEQGFEYLELFD